MHVYIFILKIASHKDKKNSIERKILADIEKEIKDKTMLFNTTQSYHGTMLMLAEKSLDSGALRHQVISDNIANIDTPHYKRKIVTFEAEVNRVIADRKQERYPLFTNHDKHIPTDTIKTLQGVVPKVRQEFDSNYRNDKNNVDIEKEMSDQVKNTLHYSAVATLISKNFSLLKSVIT